MIIVMRERTKSFKSKFFSEKVKKKSLLSVYLKAVWILRETIAVYKQLQYR
jgi:hypothetical protein